jgi:hypothetical protein
VREGSLEITIFGSFLVENLVGPVVVLLSFRSAVGTAVDRPGDRIDAGVVGLIVQILGIPIPARGSEGVLRIGG